MRLGEGEAIPVHDVSEGGDTEASGAVDGGRSETSIPMMFRRMPSCCVDAESETSMSLAKCDGMFAVREEVCWS